MAAPCGNDGSLRLKSKWPTKRGDAGRGLIVFLVLSALQQSSFRQELSLISSAPDKNNQRDCPALHGRTQATTEGNLPFVGKFFQKEDFGNVCRSSSRSLWAGSGREKLPPPQQLLPGREPAKARSSQQLPPPLGLRHPFLHLIHDCVESGIKTIPQSPSSVPWLRGPCSSALSGLLVDSCFIEPRIPALRFSLLH